MRRGHGHGDAGLADLESPQAVHDAHLGHGPAATRLARDLLHHRQRHLLVGLVLEVAHGAAAALVADHAEEHADPAVGGARHRQGGGVDGRAGQPDVCVARGLGHAGW